MWLKVGKIGFSIAIGILSIIVCNKIISPETEEIENAIKEEPREPDQIIHPE